MHKRRLRVFSLLLAVCMLAVMMPAAALAAEEPAVISAGEVVEVENGKKYVITIPEGSGEQIKLDLADYLRASISAVYEGNGNWGPNLYSWSKMPLVIQNESGRTYTYEDARFFVDMTDEPQDEYYFISEKDPYENNRQGVPYHSIVRVVSQPIQALYNKQAGDVTLDEMVNVEEKIQAHGDVIWQIDGETVTHTIPDSVNTYAAYALWYYNAFFQANANSLLELPMQYKLNLLGSNMNNLGKNLAEGTVTVSETIPASSEEAYQELISKQQNFGMSFAQNENDSEQISTIFVETDPQLLEMAHDVFYGFVLRCSFTRRDDYDRLFLYPNEYFPEIAEDELTDFMKDPGSLSWKSLSETQLDAKALEGENLTIAQQSVKKSIGSLNLEDDKAVEYDEICLTMPFVVTPNALYATGGLAGLRLEVTLQGGPLPTPVPTATPTATPAPTPTLTPAPTAAPIQQGATNTGDSSLARMVFLVVAAMSSAAATGTMAYVAKKKKAE